MSRWDDFEDDGRTIADMSGLERPPLLPKRPRSFQGKKEKTQNEKKKNPWEDSPFTWGERLRYMGVALGAALSIAFVLLGGLAVIIWLITLYAK